MNDQERQEIDAMSLEDMFRKWRFTPIGHPYFSNDPERFGYFHRRMLELLGQHPDPVSVSEQVGWER